jgi:DNA polymerase elongation subunit (family B)
MQQLHLRPELTAPFTGDLVFQILDVVVNNEKVPTMDTTDLRPLVQDVMYRQFAQASVSNNRRGPGVVYLFGCTPEGYSVTLAVNAFKPWFFVELTPQVDGGFLRKLHMEFKKQFGIGAALDFVEKKRAYGWVPVTDTDPTDVRTFTFAQFSFPTVAAMRSANYMLEMHNLRITPDAELSRAQVEKKRDLNEPPRSSCLSGFQHKIDVSETKTQPSEKFLATRNLVASAWARVEAGLYELHDVGDRATVANIEAECSVDAIVPHQLDRVAPIVIAAVDIEVQSGDFRSFPDASNPADACTYIGTTFWVYGDKKPRARVMQVLGACDRVDDVDGMQVVAYEDEYELLCAWRDLIAIYGDPDKVVSYNGTGFDFAYMSKRFERLREERQVYSRFNHLSRFLYLRQPLYTRELESAAMGQNELSSFPMTGRWQMDLFQYVKVNHKLSSYKLDDVSRNFLGASGPAGAVSKIVLDLHGWVHAKVAEAKRAVDDMLEELRAAVTGHEQGEQVVPIKLRCKRCLEQALEYATRPLPVLGAADAAHDSVVLAAKAFDDMLDACLNDDDDAVTGLLPGVVAIIGDGDGDGDDPERIVELGAVKDESLRYVHVFKMLEKALDLLGKAVELVQQLTANADAQRPQRMRDAVYSSVQPALDASGSDNYKKLFRMYVEGPAHRAQIARYCQVDCDLVLYLMDRISVVPNTVQMSQVCNTLLGDIANRGQQIKTFNLIARYCFNDNYVMNFRAVGWDPTAEYEGATVLPPKPGYYTTPVSTLDFASLYPSIMQAYNLCFSSIVLEPAYQGLEEHGAQYGRYPIAGKTWVFQEHKKGILPRILAELVDARRQCKKEMKKFEKGSLDYKLADGKQLALKVSCNSVYGFCGVLNNGMFPCMPVAVATTFNGRNLIQQTKRFVETNYGANVIYGDTDSVMLQFPGVTTVAQAFEMAEEVSVKCSATFRDVVKLEFEKVYLPYLLIKKKHYAGIKYDAESGAGAPPTLDAKGLALVRRDNCQLVRTAMREVLHSAMRDGNPRAAYDAVARHVQRLVNREVSMEELEISNFLRKDLKDDHHPHIQVVKNMEARHAFGIPRVGDRVPYVILENKKKDSKIYERAEHPKYVAEHGLKIDREYYLVNQLQKRLEKVLTPLPIPSAEALFSRALAEITRQRQGMQRLDSFSGFAIVAAPVRSGGGAEGGAEDAAPKKRAHDVSTAQAGPASAPVQRTILGDVARPVKKAVKKAKTKTPDSTKQGDLFAMLGGGGARQ